MTKISRELGRIRLSERHQSTIGILCLPQKFIDQCVDIHKVNFANRPHVAVLFMGAINARFSQYFEWGDRQSHPGIELIAQEAAPNAAIFNGATQIGTEQDEYILTHKDRLLDKFS
jgi:hypothetical protein